MSEPIKPATRRRKRSPDRSAAIKAKKAGQLVPGLPLTARPSTPARTASRAAAQRANADSRKHGSQLKRTKAPKSAPLSASHREKKKDCSSLRRSAEGAHEKLKRSEEKFRSLVETAAVPIFLLSPAFVVLEFNAEAERAHRRRRGRLVGRDYFEALGRRGAAVSRVPISRMFWPVVLSAGSRNASFDRTAPSASCCGTRAD
jgi:hypothetical protein